jgi:hypothetical protein
VRIGHVEETVAYYDENFKLQRVSVPEWRNRFTENPVKVTK